MRSTSRGARVEGPNFEMYSNATRKASAPTLLGIEEGSSLVKNQDVVNSSITTTRSGESWNPIVGRQSYRDGSTIVFSDIPTNGSSAISGYQAVNAEKDKVMVKRGTSESRSSQGAEMVSRRYASRDANVYDERIPFYPGSNGQSSEDEGRDSTPTYQPIYPRVFVTGEGRAVNAEFMDRDQDNVQRRDVFRFSASADARQSSQTEVMFNDYTGVKTSDHAWRFHNIRGRPHPELSIRASNLLYRSLCRNDSAAFTGNELGREFHPISDVVELGEGFSTGDSDIIFPSCPESNKISGICCWNRIGDLLFPRRSGTSCETAV
ncbi:protein P3b [Raspberry latent virus]|uniref:protein P3b n=1 Tax=Raspberry latent virus TaxID=907191 RepID=UPI0001E6901A|nr:protein P3b [Raspberry latent virus]ADO27689.1 protein P3b [Raspberry latent virus]